ncbi:MAG TPA: Tat pathway signal protein, partial [Acidobacteriaceae bacterium]|nr:Tat pathway signal protein [Acidobacteriaceae bacterium]
KADPRIKADVDLVALQYGPLIYNVETADQHNLDQPLSNDPLKAEWRPDLLGGVMVITGKWQDGTPMLAIPNYVRMNRVEHENPAVAGDSSVNYAPGATGGTTNNAPKAGAAAPGSTTPQTPLRRARGPRKIDSQVWMKSSI